MEVIIIIPRYVLPLEQGLPRGWEERSMHPAELATFPGRPGLSCPFPHPNQEDSGVGKSDPPVRAGSVHYLSALRARPGL